MVKNCEACSKELSFRDSFVFKGSSVCRECLTKLESGEEINGFTPKNQPKEQAVSSTTSISTSYQFKTLLGYGKFISGFGWVVVLIGIISIIGGLASGSEASFGIAGGALVLIILGISMVISGQVISCFVSIEKNTRATYELLKEKQT